MSESKSINLMMISTLLEAVIDDYKSRGIHSVDISDKDEYWSISTDEMFDIYEQSDEASTLGSLQDDLKELSKLLNQEERVATAVDMERIGNLLRAVSQVLVE